MGEKARQLSESFDVKALKAQCQTDTVEACQDLANGAVFMLQQDVISWLQEQEIPYERIQGSGEGLFSYGQRLLNSSPELSEFYFGDLAFHYGSEHKTIHAEAVPDPVNIYEGQTVWIEIDSITNKPVIHVHGLETKPLLSLPKRVESHDDWEQALRTFGMEHIDKNKIKVGVMDAEPENLAVASKPEYGMEVVREGNNLIITKLPQIKWNTSLKPGKYGTWRAVIESGFADHSDLKGNYNQALKMEVSYDGGLTTEPFRNIGIAPVESDMWLVDGVFYVNNAKTEVTNSDPGTWRELLEGFGLDYVSYPYLKIQKIGEDEHYTMTEIDGFDPKHDENHPLLAGHVNLVLDPSTRMLYWSKSSVEEVVVDPDPIKPIPKKPEAVEATVTVGVPTPRLKPEAPKRMPSKYEHAAIYKSDAPVLEYVFERVGIDADEVNRSNVASMLMNGIASFTPEQYIAFRKKFGAKRTLIKLFKRYEISTAECKDQLVVAVSKVVDGIKKDSKEHKVMMAFGGPLEFKNVLMKLSFHETAGRLNHSKIGEIRGFNFSNTACQGFYQFNWRNTKNLKVNPFNAEGSTEGIITLMVENSSFYDRAPLKTKASRAKYKKMLTDKKISRADFILAAHNGGWMAAFTGKKGGGPSNKNPEPYDFVKKIKAVHDYTDEFKAPSLAVKMASLR